MSELNMELKKLRELEIKTKGLATRIQTTKNCNGELDVDLLQLQIENKKLKNRLFILKKSIAEESTAGGVQLKDSSSITEHLESLFAQAIASAFPEYRDTPVVIAPVNSSSAKFGDYQCNNAMGLSKKFKESGISKAPREIATELKGHCPPSPIIEKLEVAGAGFVNVFLSK
ncbi:hypothetical protein M5D96_011661 [Drosophila gunungcola]|nr:hypothetical protein M5D96_011661 [Drosophila gunungcola]